MGESDDDCDMVATGRCMFKRSLPAISLAVNYVVTDNGRGATLVFVEKGRG